MKVLLDEGVPDIIKRRLASVSIFTVQDMSWQGVKNGDLFALMAVEFQVLITTDKSIPYQQNLMKWKISVIILPANDIPTVIGLLSEIAQAIQSVLPGDFRQLEMPNKRKG